MTRFAVPILAVFLALAACPPKTSALDADRVVLLIIDGLRASEGLEDPDHAHIPDIWNTLRPQGFVSHAFYNDHVTLTMPGHATLAAGTAVTLPNDGSERPDRALLWEVLRRRSGLPAEKALLVATKEKLGALSYSEGAGYGMDDSATVLVDSTFTDEDVVESFKSYAEVQQPVLSLVSLGHVDIAGHTGSWVDYVSAIETADRLALELWEWIQSDPFYSGRTAFFITSDHGRHTDDWTSHGDGCIGCRRIPLVALGPDIQPGVESDGPADLRDLGVTAASFFGLQMPDADGRYLGEMMAGGAASAEIAGGPASEGSLRIWPVPARDVAYARSLRPLRGTWRLGVYTVQGRRIFEETVSGAQLESGLGILRSYGAIESRVSYVYLTLVEGAKEPTFSASILWLR